MNSIDILRDGLGRIAEDLPAVIDGLDSEQLSYQPSEGANSIGWLVWHLTRVEDNHIAHLARQLGHEEHHELISEGWSARLGLPYPDEVHGYGMSTDDVAAFHVDGPQVLADYFQAVRARTLRILDLIEADGPDEVLDRIVDTQWTPHVTAGVRLVSVMNDLTQHIGQAAYLRGLLPLS